MPEDPNIDYSHDLDALADLIRSRTVDEINVLKADALTLLMMVRDCRKQHPQ